MTELQKALLLADMAELQEEFVALTDRMFTQGLYGWRGDETKREEVFEKAWTIVRERREFMNRKFRDLDPGLLDVDVS